MKLITSLKCRTDNYFFNSDLKDSIKLSCRYLYVSEVLHVTGQTMQSPCLAMAAPVMKHKPSSTGTEQEAISQCDNERLLLTNLLVLWGRTMLLTKKDCTALSPAPWAQDSEFTALKKTLDTLPIFYAEQLQFDIERFEVPTSQENDLGEYVLSLSILHALQILLNRVFLPIGVAASTSESGSGEAEHHEVSDDDTEYSSINRRRASSSARTEVQFPGAPALFLKERSAACIRSARSITMICENIISHDVLIVCQSSRNTQQQGSLANKISLNSPHFLDILCS